MTRRKNYIYAREFRTDKAGQLSSVHGPWHPNVAQNESDLHPAPQSSDRFIGSCSFKNCVAGFAQKLSGGEPIKISSSTRSTVKLGVGSSRASGSRAIIFPYPSLRLLFNVSFADQFHAEDPLNQSCPSNFRSERIPGDWTA
jgi:hypothetical protein